MHRDLETLNIRNYNKYDDMSFKKKNNSYDDNNDANNANNDNKNPGGQN